MKKFLLTFVLILALLFVPFGITGCGDSGKKPLSANEFYAMGIASGANYLKLLTAVQSLSGIDAEHKPTIERYVSMFGGLLNNGIHPTASNTTESDGSYASTYQKKLVVTIQNVNYVLYYNEVDGGTQSEDDEVEVSTFIQGIAVLGTDTYYVKGGKIVETETEHGKTETETELKMIISDTQINISNEQLKDTTTLSGGNYVILEEEFESDEYEYSYVTSADPTNPVSIEFENERGKEELEIKIGTTEYKITRINDAKFKIVQIINNQKTTYYIEKQDNSYVYTNSQGTQI